jgi:flagellum-specific peptidoglycan hydrolase FlgJ
MTPSQFFEKLGKHAVDSTAGTGLLPSIALAQAALESGYGKSELSSKYNNYFGIKAVGKQKSVPMRTREVIKGQSVWITAPFRVFDSLADAFKVRVKFLSTKRYKPVLEAKTPAAQALALQKAGYATDPNYARLLVSIVNSNNLQRFDEMAKKKPLFVAVTTSPSPFYLPTGFTLIAA